MASTASQVSTTMEVIAAMGKPPHHMSLIVLTCATDLFYDLRLNAGVAIFQIFSTQMIGYGVAGICESSYSYSCYQVSHS